MFKLSALR